ncbi:MAG: hypothetical protein QXR30_04240 [Candidatus Woesearchaeota archaeon]
MFVNEKKLRKSFAKIKYDMIALDKKVDKKYEDLKKYVDNVEKMLNQRIDAILAHLNEQNSNKKNRKRKTKN